MNAYDAAEALQTRLEVYSWLNAVAVGEFDGRPAIYAYTKTAVRHPELQKLKSDGWMGYKVLIEKVGIVKPAAFI